MVTWATHQQIGALEAQPPIPVILATNCHRRRVEIHEPAAWMVGAIEILLVNKVSIGHRYNIDNYNYSCIYILLSLAFLLIICMIYTCARTHAHTHTLTVCPSLSLDNGDVSYSPANRSIGSIATYTCNPGYQLSSPQGGITRTCSMNGWSDLNFSCERGEYLWSTSNYY